MEEIVQNPHHYKNLKYPLNDFKRVHISIKALFLFLLLMKMIINFFI